ncbi:MAG: DUF455 family protein, partial [Methylococcales bacterium]|nr:DUF455 family protein [Methylococcales bacterium]
MNSLGEESSHQPVSQIAERILFAESLDEKLRMIDADQVSFEDRSSVKLSGKRILPGRPVELLFTHSNRQIDKRQAPPLPATPHLVNEENRGILLHFFANHELLAAELMSLALLRFPDAPKAFRKGLYQTLREEQRHTK